MFIDIELSSNRIEEVRTLFERVVSLNLSPKKMKTFLKRFLQFEKQHGTQENVENVKNIAKEYIERKNSSE